MQGLAFLFSSTTVSQRKEIAAKILHFATDTYLYKYEVGYQDYDPAVEAGGISLKSVLKHLRPRLGFALPSEATMRAILNQMVEDGDLVRKNLFGREYLEISERAKEPIKFLINIYHEERFRYKTSDERYRIQLQESEDQRREEFRQFASPFEYYLAELEELPVNDRDIMSTEGYKAQREEWRKRDAEMAAKKAGET